MLNMYYILELRRGITIPQAETMSLHDHLAIEMKAVELEKQSKFEEANKLELQYRLFIY